MKSNKQRLYADVAFLSGIYPARNHANVESIEEAASYIEDQFEALDAELENQYFEVNNCEYRNVIASFNPHCKKRLIVGAHYDVCGDTPGADDNASAIAGLLECARLFDKYKPKINYRVDFVAFCLEEPPYFGTPDMGSAVHVRSLSKCKNDVMGMICLEMIGYFSDKPGSQELPEKSMNVNLPDRGNFIIIAGRNHQKEFAEKVTGLLQEQCSVKAFTLTDPRLDSLLGMSDHANYWKYGFNAVMINDTSMMRNKNYHLSSDTIDKLDFDSMSEVVNGCYNAIVNM